MSEATIHAGHRARIRERFLSGDGGSRSDESLLELLLTYAIPQRDVGPIAAELLSQFGSLDKVLAARIDDLCQVEGIKANSAVLLKVADAIKIRGSSQQHSPVAPSRIAEGPDQGVFINLTAGDNGSSQSAATLRYRKPVARYGSELFGKAVLKEAIEMLPKLPESDSLDDARAYLRNNLHFSGEQTRRRYSAYITRRMFPDGLADAPLRHFARAYPASTELRDVCFYRFCRAEPLMLAIMSDVFLPALGMGRIRRERIKTYLEHKFPHAKGVDDCVQSIVDVLVAAGLATSQRQQLSFASRQVCIPSFAFILHNEFRELGMYEISKIEANPIFLSLLWTPDKILAALYELRNARLISKISEIDSIRQFTLKFDLAAIVKQLSEGRAAA